MPPRGSIHGSDDSPIEEGESQQRQETLNNQCINKKNFPFEKNFQSFVAVGFNVQFCVSVSNICC